MKVLFHKQLITQYKPTGILSKHGHRCILCSRVVPCGQTDWQRLTWAKTYAFLDICENYLIRHTDKLTSCSDFIDRNGNVTATGFCSSSTPVPSSTLTLTSSISSEDVRYLSVVEPGSTFTKPMLIYKRTKQLSAMTVLSLTALNRIHFWELRFSHQCCLRFK